MSRPIQMTKTSTSVLAYSSLKSVSIMLNVMLASIARQTMVVGRTVLVSTSRKKEITVLQTFHASTGACAISRTRGTIKVFASRGSPLIHQQSWMMNTIQSYVGQTIP